MQHLPASLTVGLKPVRMEQCIFVGCALTGLKLRCVKRGKGRLVAKVGDTDAVNKRRKRRVGFEGRITGKRYICTQSYHSTAAMLLASSRTFTLRWSTTKVIKAHLKKY